MQLHHSLYLHAVRHERVGGLLHLLPQHVVEENEINLERGASLSQAEPGQGR